MDFIALLRWQVAGLGLAFAMRIFSHILTAHQRMDIPNWAQACAMGVNFSVQWWFFHRGQGVFSLAWGYIAGVFLSTGVSFIGCLVLPVLPTKGAWGRASWQYFQELFAYGKDLFLVAVGTQLIMASQIMIITRRLGADTAGLWAVGTRAFSLLFQLISRIVSISMPALSEMIVRGERANLAGRFKDVVIVSASVSGFAAVGLAGCNQSFVHILSHGNFSWAPQYDILLGIWLMLLSILGCHNNLVLATKDVRMMRYIYFIEGSVFVVVAWLASQFGGLAGIIASSIVCTSCFSFGYGIRRSSEYFQIPVRELLIGWLSPMYRVVCFTAPVAVVAWIATQSLDAYPRFAIMAGVCGTVGLLILVFQGLPAPLRSELLARSPKPVSGMFQRLLNFR
jgi:O-antigen/teichoic acid export membrane protein